MKYEIFEELEIVKLDADFANSSIVTVRHQTPNRMFTNIESGGVRWDVMTDRLSKSGVERINYKLIKPNEGQKVRLFLNKWKNDPIMDMIWHKENTTYDDWNMVEYWIPLENIN